MKKILFLFSFAFLLFFSCHVNPKPDPVINPDKPGPNVNTGDETKYSVTLKNQSQFDVNLYIDKSPYYDVSPTYTVNKNSEYNCELLPSDDTGYTVYIEYLIDIGNVKFPYWNINNSKYLIVKENDSADLIINPLEECESKSAYFYIENNTTSDIFMQNGMSYVRPSGQQEYLISSGKAAVYEVNETSTAISYGNYSQLKLVIGTENYTLPFTKENVQKGNIYTISVSNDESSGKSVVTASLKAITPFNIDTQKKIWSKDNSLFTTDYDNVMRLGYDKKNTLIIGTSSLDETKIGLARLNEFGEYTTQNDNFVAFTGNKNLTSTEIIDFIEQKDGSIVMLCRQSFTTDNYYYNENFVFICYDFSSKSIKWSKIIPSDAPLADGSFYELTFRKDSKNKLVQIGDNKFVCVGIYNKIKFNETETDFDYNILKYMIIYIDGNDINEKNVVNDSGLKIILSSDFINHASSLERNLTSAFFDGSDLYICGCDNWDSLNYNSTHVGKIWKISPAELDASDGTFDFSAASNIVYSCNNCLFFSMDGSGSDYVVCGEYTDNGKLLKGCYVTSAMIKSDPSCKPVLYTVKGKNYCWFNQLCQYGNKMVFCGKSSDEMDGSKSPLPFVVAFDYKGNKLWENLTYTSYTDALNILPNTIGTYTLQLSRGKIFRSEIHYVNADLLGNEVK